MSNSEVAPPDDVPACSCCVYMAASAVAVLVNTLVIDARCVSIELICLVVVAVSRPSHRWRRRRR